MEYPTGYLIAPSDYGNQTSGLDRKALKKSLKDTRAAIKDIVKSSNKTFKLEGGEVLSAETLASLAKQPNTDEYRYVKPTDELDPNDFLDTTPYSAPEGVAEQNEKDQAFLDAFRLSLEQKAPKNKGDGKKDKKDKKDKTEGLKLPGLGDATPYSFDLYSAEREVPMEAPDDFKENPTFDGRDFDYFLKRAKALRTTTSGRGPSVNTPADPDKNKLYNALKDAGLSEEEMYKGAQHAGIKNLRTESDSIADDIAKIKHAIDNNYYEGTVTEGGGLKSERDLFQEFKDLGGKGKLKEFKDAQKYGSYDSKKDAKQFADYLAKQLTKQNIYASSGLDKATNAFGNKFTMKDYNQALGYKNQDAKYIAEYLKDFIKRGGKVGDRVLALLTPEKDVIKYGSE